ncbi:unnamed protein product, partial [Didymodactylos carnosus]
MTELPFPTTTTQKGKSSKKLKQVKSFSCEWINCGESFGSKNQLNKHQMVQHLVLIRAQESDPTTIEQSAKGAEQQPLTLPEMTRVSCGYGGCERSFDAVYHLKMHTVAKHLIINRCPYCCTQTNENFHRSEYPIPMCFDPKCQRKTFEHWFQ